MVLIRFRAVGFFWKKKFRGSVRFFLKKNFAGSVQFFLMNIFAGSKQTKPTMPTKCWPGPNGLQNADNVLMAIRLSAHCVDNLIIKEIHQWVNLFSKKVDNKIILNKWTKLEVID